MLKTLNYVHWQLGHLNVIKDLPETDIPTGILINRVTDVKSAMLNYIAIHIRHEGDRLGLAGSYRSSLRDLYNTGNIATSVFTGNHDCESSSVELEKTIQNFNTAFFHFGHRIGLKTFNSVEGNSVKSRYID